MAYERKYKVTKTIKDIYKVYKEEKGIPEVDLKTFKEILYELNKTIADLIIKESFEYKVPYKLGYLRIKKNKLNLKLKDGKIDVQRNMPDWKASIDFWEKKYGTRNKKELKKIPNKKFIYQMNEQTNGDIMRWFWDKKLTNVKNHTVYMFKPVKGGTFEDDKRVNGRLGLRDWILSDDRKNDYYY